MSWGPSLLSPADQVLDSLRYRFRLMPFVSSVTVMLLHTTVIGGVQSGWNVAVDGQAEVRLAVLDREVASRG